MYSWIWWLDIYAVNFPAFVYWRVFRTVKYSGFERIYLVMMLLCRLDITLIIICKLFESLSIKATSSAQVGVPMYTLPRWYPNEFSSSSNKRSCTKILYKCVDKIPPCLTPCKTGYVLLNSSFHFTLVVRPLYMSSIMDHIASSIFWSNSLSISIICWTTSKAGWNRYSHFRSGLNWFRN